MSENSLRCYGSKTQQRAVLHMCGGCPDWWDYVLIFDKEGNYELHKENQYGLHHLGGQLFYNTETEELRRQNGVNDEGIFCKENEIEIEFDFFDWG
tara:strand:+ start:1159 stop:1446 length:288 start_codon:yes stop_codon:yes gene_type:complete